MGLKIFPRQQQFDRPKNYKHKLKVHKITFKLKHRFLVKKVKKAIKKFRLSHAVVAVDRNVCYACNLDPNT
jgi:hypothetical protein